MQKKIFSLLVLLMTAVSGAVAQSYEAKVFDVPASWTEDETRLSAADLPEDFVQITNDEAKALAVPDGTVFLIYGFEGDKVKVMFFESGTFSGEEEAPEVRAMFVIYQTNNAKICYTAPAGSSVPVTEVTKNEWQFTMPDYAVVAKIEYDTELALNEVDDNTAKLEEWDGYEADVTLTRTLQAGSWNTFAAPFNVEATWLAYLKSQYGMSVKQLTSTSISGETIYLNFEDAQTIEAGKPYLVKVTSDFDFSAQALPGIEVSKDPVPVTTTYADFIPTLGKTTIEGVDAENILFVAAENKLKNPSEIPAYMKGFRGYFQLKEAAEVKSFVLDFGDGDVATGLLEIGQFDNSQSDNSVYDLQGRRFESKPAQKGVYVKNGKKVINK